MTPTLLESPTPPRVPDGELARIWRDLAQDNAWPDLRCPDDQRREWVAAIAYETRAIEERVEQAGVTCGVLRTSGPGWQFPLEEKRERVELELTARTCAHCGAAYFGKGRARYCGRLCKEGAALARARKGARK